jgi:hypothetical protein
MVGTTLVVSYGALFSTGGSNVSTVIVTQTTTSDFTVIEPITQTVTSSSTVFSTPYQIGYVNQTTGLMLQLSLNATTIDEISQNNWTSILVLISEYNIRPESNNVTAENDWLLQGLSLGQCQNGPIGIGIFPGGYSLANISLAGKVLSLFPPIFCPAFTFPPVLSPFYLFAPQSDNAEVEGGYAYQYNYSNNRTATFTDVTYDLETISSSVSLNSYCCREIIGGQNCGCITYGFIPFKTGTYTIVGGDEWGDMVLTHFRVISASFSYTTPTTNESQTYAVGTSSNTIP